MGALNATLAFKEKSALVRGMLVGINLAPSGNYTVGGDTLDLTAFIPGKPSVIPVAVNSPIGNSGRQATYKTGTTKANGTVFYRQTTGAEYTASAYAAGDAVQLIFIAPAD